MVKSRPSPVQVEPIIRYNRPTFGNFSEEGSSTGEKTAPGPDSGPGPGSGLKIAGLSKPGLEISGPGRAKKTRFLKLPGREARPGADPWSSIRSLF